MDNTILELSDRGQLTIPKKVRQIMVVKRFICQVRDNKIILEPLQTRDEFLTELENAKKEWKTKGGLTVKEIKKKYQL
ncbi:MAG: hypothetical protein AAB953_00755 [Patescibacteria group bacterium]